MSSATGSAVSPLRSGPGWTTVLRGAVSQRNPLTQRPSGQRSPGMLDPGARLYEHMFAILE